MANISSPESDIIETCRICLSNEKLNSSIFSYSLVNNITFAQTFMACTSVQILIDDGFPSLICDNCLENLESFLDLCQRCIKSDLILRNSIKNINELKPNQIVIKSENDDSEDWHKYNLRTDNVTVNNNFSSFAFVRVEDRTEEDLTEWFSRQTKIVKEENPTLEDKRENMINPSKKYIRINKKNSYDDKINIIREKDLNKIYSKKKDQDLNEDSKTSQLQCDVCGKFYNRKCALVAHARIHIEVRPYKCSVCTKSFTKKALLDKHRLIHSGERPFGCNKCGKSFNQKSNLLTHMTVHTGEQRFLCDICSKQFSQKINLLTHMLTHSGEKPYKCKTCGRKFSYKCGLTAHETTHSNLKPFKCETCGKSFSRRELCKVHVKTHSGEKPFECKICGRAFGRKDKLTTHLRTH